MTNIYQIRLCSNYLLAAVSTNWMPSTNVLQTKIKYFYSMHNIHYRCEIKVKVLFNQT